MVLTREAVKRVLALLEGISELVAKLLYGCGLQIAEAVRLRVKDIDYGYNKQLTVRNGKGNKNRVMAVHEQDLAAGFGAVYLPYCLLACALARRYPNAEMEWVGSP